MAEIIPALTREVMARMQRGEIRFAQRLKDFLEDDYLCWYDIPVGKERRYPDFIILHPGRGLLFLEVKAWTIDTLKKVSVDSVELQLSDGRKTVANPFAQVRQCAHVATNKLESDKALTQRSGRHKGKLVAPYGWGVVFTNITRQQIEKAIPDEAAREKLLPDHLMIYKDEMAETQDPERFQERLWQMFPYTFAHKLTLPQINKIRWHLFPEVRIDHAIQADFFAEEDAKPGAETSAGIPDIFKVMDIQQEQLARSLGQGHRVIHGVAGSGKTLILGYRAEYLAQASAKPILVLCFNISLAARLRAMMKSKQLQDKVEVCHFHDWCKAQLNTYNVDVKAGNKPYWERQVESVIDGVERDQIPRAQYGAVLIDEGHDFEAEWLRLVVQMIDPDTESLLLLYDDAQSIYKKNKGLGFTLSSVGVQAQGRTTILRLNYRNTREILDFSYRFAAEAMLDTQNTGNSEESIPLVKPEAAGASGAYPIAKLFDNWPRELDYAVRCIRTWHEKGQAWRDIAIIYSAAYQGELIAAKLSEEGIPHLWMGSKSHKQAYDPSENRLTVTTIQSSKGLEFPTVVMMGVGQLNHSDEAYDVRCLYVGLTRAQQHLLVTSSNENTMTTRLLSLSA